MQPLILRLDQEHYMVLMGANAVADANHTLTMEGRLTSTQPEGGGQRRHDHRECARLSSITPDL